MNPLQKAAGSLVSSLIIGVSSFKSIGSIGLIQIEFATLILTTKSSPVVDWTDLIGLT